jgi:hypothetical protein
LEKQSDLTVENKKIYNENVFCNLEKRLSKNSERKTRF